VLAVLSLLSVVCAFVLGLYGASAVLRSARETAAVLPFESGLLPTQHAVSRYHARWYAVTILFLAFDMEMVFMYPWALVVAEMGRGAVIEMFGFLAVLVVGVVYVWREGALRWT
jgi:NADH-quinone oxidoreductase subunit A